MPKEESYELKQVDVRLKLSETRPLYSRNEISNPERAVEIMKKALSELDREYFCVVNLDSKNRPMHFNVVSIGDIDMAPVPMQNVFKSAILSNASSIMAFHNHPSGDITPSHADIDLTEKLVDAGRLMNIPVQDHIIVGEGQHLSLKEYDKDLFSHDRNIIDKTRGDPKLQPDIQIQEYKNIVEYAKEKNVNVHVINGFVSAHRDEFVGHIKKDKVGAAVDRWGLEKIANYIDNKPKDGITRFTRYSKELSKRREVSMDFVAEQKKDRVLTPEEVDKLYSNPHAMIDSGHGMWPVGEFLDIYCSQRGYDDYKDVRQHGFSIDLKESSIVMDEHSSDAERGIDVPDMDDSIDDRISVTGGNPTKNPAKSKAKSVKHYSVSKNKSVIMEQLRKKEAEIESLREEMKTIDHSVDLDVTRDEVDFGR